MRRPSPDALETMMITYPFSAEEAQAAFDEWGCNCGPASLAFALGVGLDYIRESIPGFAEKRYTSPSMMAAALKNNAQQWKVVPPRRENLSLADDFRLLVRIQWTGPWTMQGANPKWAYRQTHWICACGRGIVFDINGGVRTLESWEKEIVPILVANTPRADGNWFPTHIWRISR
jgi:hypothetical protein